MFRRSLFEEHLFLTSLPTCSNSAWTNRSTWIRERRPHTGMIAGLYPGKVQQQLAMEESFVDDELSVLGGHFSVTYSA